MHRERAIVPLLSNYKHGLARRRFLETITGGVKLKRYRFCWFNLLLLCLYFSPIAFASPFIILDALGVWNSYYLAIVYSFIHTTIVFSMRIFIYIKTSRDSLHNEQNDEFNDDDDDDDLEGENTCCTFKSISSIFSQKHIIAVVIHCLLVCLLLSFTASFTLSPRVLAAHLSLPGAVVVGIIGWLSLCVVHYSLTVSQPHEVAVYRHTNLLGLDPLTRPFYFISCASSIIVIRLVLAHSTTVDLIVSLLYVALCLLPLGWTLGCLPPLDALIPWTMELVLTHFMGGSPMATDFRLLVMFLLSTVCTTLIVILRVFQPHLTPHLLLATITGYLLSHDIFSFIVIPLRYLLGPQSRIVRWRKYAWHVVKASLRGCILVVVSLILVYFARRESKMVARTVLGVIILALYLILFTSHTIQRIYVIGLIRNPLHPWRSENTLRYKTRRRWLSYCSLLPQLVFTYLAPLLMLAFLAVLKDSVCWQWLSAIGIARIHRKVWQNTWSGLSELCVVALLSLGLSEDNWWVELGAGLQTLVVGLSLEIGHETLQKLWFGIILYSKFLLQDGKKLRRRAYAILALGSPLLLLLLLVSALFSSIVSAPLLPLFTLPIFLISFPRTRRFWPSLYNYGTSFNQCNDSIYYKHDVDWMSRALLKVFSTGSARGQPGECYMLRCQDRTIIATVLEHGHCFYTLNLRGLEIEETSCHTVEALRIDDIFSAAYDDNSSTKRLGFWFNCYPLSNMLPVDSIVVQTYSRSQISLTGIIDQPQGLQRFSENLLKCIVWVLHWYASDEQTPSPGGGLEERGREEKFEMKHRVKWSLRNKVAPAALSESSQDPDDEDAPNDGTKNSCLRPSRESDIHLNSRLTLNPTISANPMQSLIPVNVPLNHHHQNISLASQTYTHHHCPKDTSFPLDWQDFPPTADKLLSSFPTEWSDYIYSRQPLPSGKTLSSSPVFKKLCLTCHSIMDIPLSSHGNARTKPHHIHKGFCGEVPYSMNRDWLVKKPVLKDLILQAYRYAVKLMCDEAALGETEDSSELYDYLQAYRTDHHIGREGEPSWSDAVLSHTLNLFSLSKSQENDTSYNALVLSLQDEVVRVGWLNPQAVRAIWSNLTVELLYLTNDDEERYSIQAHPSLFRNLTIQAADPPLGYPIFSSGLTRSPPIT